MTSPSTLRTAYALIAITRPGNTTLTALSVYVGSVCAYAPLGVDVALACLSAALIAAGGYVVNDVFDLEIDRVNRPDRPLPRGDLSRPAAAAWATVLTAMGLASSWPLGWPLRAIALIVVVVLTAYAAKLKRTVLVGHTAVAVVSGLAFIYGGLLGPEARMALVPAALACAFHLGREMLKCAADLAGDRSAGAETMAVRWGVARTCKLATLPLGLMVLASPLPTLWGWFGVPYLVAVLLGADMILLHVSFSAFRRPDELNASRLASIMKWGMLAGLVAVWGDRWILWQAEAGF